MGLFRRLSNRGSGKELGHDSHEVGPKKNLRQSETSDTLNESQLSDGSMKLTLSDVQIIENYMAIMNQHAPAEELLSYWTSPRAKVALDDYDGMTARQWVKEVGNLYGGFGDLLFTFKKIKEIGPGIVQVEKLVVTGTHTGDLKFMDFPVLAKTDKAVVLDPENLYFTMKNGKIQKMEDCALGNLTGPPGMYLAVGGTLEKASKTTRPKNHRQSSTSDTSKEFEAPPSPAKLSSIQVVEDYMAALKRHAPAEELLRFWTSPRAKVTLDEYDGMTARQLVKETCNLYHAFGDIRFSYKKIKHIGPGVVMVDKLVVSGTHTAELKFMDLPAIAKTDKSVVLDPERLYFTVKNGKIQKMENCCLGRITGPPGMYKAVGGTLD